MAKVRGVIKINGSIDDLTFYQRNGKNFVREKSSLTGERVKTDPSFARTRENYAEFGGSGVAARMLRTAVGPMVNKAKDSALSSRLLKEMTLVKNFDVTSARGDRLVSNGIKTTDGKLVLVGFDFNIHSSLGNVLGTTYALNLATGVITITDLVPEEDLRYPIGATHVNFQSAVLDIDFATGDSVVAYSNVANVSIDMMSSLVTLTPTSFPANFDTQMVLLLITFSQEVNGVQYPLKNETFNVLQILDVL